MEGLFVVAVWIGSWVAFYRWAKKKNLSGTVKHGGGFLAGMFALAIAGFFVAPESSKSGKEPSAKTAAESAPPQPQKTPEEIAKEARRKQIENGFSAWDGSHTKLERIIKDSMNDPDSYKHVETVFWDMKDHLVVRTTFRGKNAFGGVVKEWVKAKCDLEGNVIKIIESSSGR